MVKGYVRNVSDEIGLSIKMKWYDDNNGY